MSLEIQLKFSENRPRAFHLGAFPLECGPFRPTPAEVPVKEESKTNSK